MALFSKAQIAEINKVAAQSKEVLSPPKVSKPKSINAELNEMSQKVIEYFKDSPAILISTLEDLHEYVNKCIEAGYAGIDTETTGLDRVKDTIVGVSLYYPGGVECYIPSKHLVPIFDTPYKGQLTYEQIGSELQRLVDAKVKMILANADYDISMIYKDLKVDFCDVTYYDVILAWRCLKENEKHNDLKSLYNKYPLKGKGDPMKFRDFFSPKLFPYCKPEVAKLYAANDAKITFDLFKWQLPYVTKEHPKCKKAHLEKIADLVWNIEFPMIKVCAMMHRNGIYIDNDTAGMLNERYNQKYKAELDKLQDMVQDLIFENDYPSNQKRPFRSGRDFNPSSPPHVKYLCHTLLKLPDTGGGTGKDILRDINLPQTNQVLAVRSLSVLINTFVKKLPNAVTPDSRIHAQFRSVGADTGRMSSAEPNLQNIPSHATDIRHMFRATPGYVMLSSDYSQQEPKLTAYVSQDPNMVKAFKEGKDIYATIASLAFNLPYEKCLEFHPETKEYQPDGKARRGEAKTIVLGICYGRSVVTIGEQLFGKDKTMSDEEKTKKAQAVYDAVLNAFPNLRALMIKAQGDATKLGYVETILGRRRHIPDMQLPEFEFKAMSGYVNPDIDPLDVTTLANKSEIPERIVAQLEKEFSNFKYYGQIVKRTKQLYEEKIKVTNNRQKITEASRQCVNSIIQGSAAELTKMAILRLQSDERWKSIGGRLLVPVHDELICEVPIDKWKEGGEILSAVMSEAGDFLPFPISCDVTTSLRWYGLEYPCQYKQPEVLCADLDDFSPDEIKWIQYHLFENEYILPVYKDENGEKPRGDAALGINGVVSDDMKNAIIDYINRYNITSDQFIDHIKQKVTYGGKD